MTLDNRFTIAKTKGTSLWNEYSERCFLTMELFSDFSTDYRIFSEYLGSDRETLESAFVLCYSQVYRFV